MENDTIRPSGTDTLVDIWVDGKLRAICITRAAIETFADFNASLGSSEDDRCEFVRGHLTQIVEAAKNRLRGANPAADTVIIDAGDLGAARERRKGDRRKGDRRKSSQPGELLPHGERRRGERRKSQRRQSPEGSKS